MNFWPVEIYNLTSLMTFLLAIFNYEKKYNQTANCLSSLLAGVWQCGQIAPIDHKNECVMTSSFFLTLGSWFPPSASVTVSGCILGPETPSESSVWVTARWLHTGRELLKPNTPLSLFSLSSTLPPSLSPLQSRLEVKCQPWCERLVYALG